MTRRRIWRGRGGPRPETGSAARPSGQPVAGRARVDGPDRLVMDDGVTLWFRVQGDKGDVVVVPCTGNAPDLFGLAVEGRRTVYYDARNRGRSDAVMDHGRLGFAREVADLGGVVEALGLERYSVVGCAYNAAIVVDHALSNPERVERLVLASAVAPRSGTATRPGLEPSPAQLAHLDQLRAADLPRRSPQQWCEEWRQVYVPLLMADPAAYLRMASPSALANEAPEHVAAAMVAVFSGLRAYDWRPALADFARPVLVVHGDQDLEPVDSAYEWAAALPGGQVLILADVGQFPWVERPDAFFGPVNRFLSGPPPGSDGPDGTGLSGSGGR